jgi:hypothetical protein
VDYIFLGFVGLVVGVKLKKIVKKKVLQIQKINHCIVIM